jgi:DNA-binding transcriptional LysR family regulator
MVQRFLEDGPNAVRPHLLTNSLDALKRFSESKSGVSIMCRSAMWREMSTGHMCAVPLDGVSPVRQELCARRTANDNPVVNAFMQEMKGIRPLKLSA